MIENTLAEFTRTYHAALEKELDAHGRENFPFHAEPSKYVVIHKAKDGFVTFYLPSSPDPNIAHGYYLYDNSQYELREICESVSVHRLKVASPRIGEPWNSMEAIPPDVESIPELSAAWIHEDVRRAATEGELDSLPGMTVSPIVKIEGGMRKRVLPGRTLVWSPTFSVPSIGMRRLFLWSHADFWWMPEELDIDINQAERIAQRDVIAFETIMREVVALDSTVAQQDTPTQAAEILDHYCDEFLELLAGDGQQEESLHQWLNEPKHHIFLDPYAVQVRSKVPFGDKVSDFVILRSDGTYLLVEIEPATLRIFQMAASEPTARFYHACQQVRDWQRFIRDNVHTVRSEQNLEGIYEPRGLVIMGRDEDIDSQQAKTRWIDMKNNYEPELATYDDICNRVRALSSTLRSTLHVH